MEKKGCPFQKKKKFRRRSIMSAREVAVWKAAESLWLKENAYGASDLERWRWWSPDVSGKKF